MFALAMLVTLAGWAWHASYGQDVPVAEKLITVDEIDSRLKELDAATDLDEKTREAIRKLYAEAQGNLEAIKANEAAIAGYDQQIATAEEETREATSRRDAISRDIEPGRPSAEAPLAQLQLELAKKIVARDEKAARRDELNAEPKRRAARVAEIPNLVKDAKTRIAVIDHALSGAAGPAPAEPTMLSQAQRAAWATETRSLASSISAMEKEAASYGSRAGLLLVQRDLAARQFAIAQDEAKAWQEVVNRRRVEEAKERASETEREAIWALPAVADLAQANTQLAEESKALAENIATASQEFEATRKLLGSISADYADTVEKVSAVGLSQASGQLLRKRRASLPDTRLYRQQIRQRRQALGKLRLALYEYEDRRLELGNLKREVKEKLADYTGERPEELEAGIRDQLKNERDLIDELIDDGQDYFRVLLQLNAKQQELIDKTNQYASFIDERALWIRSDAALGVADLQPAIDAAKWVASPDNWRQMGRQLRVAALSGIGWVIGFLIAYIPLLASQRFLRRKIDRLGSDVQRRSQTEFGPTAKTLGLTLLIAATWPALLGFVAWRLHRLLLPPGFVPAVATALGITTAIYYSIEVLRQICRGHGLAEAHFGWSNTSLAVVRRNTRWLLFAGLPLVFVAKLLYFQQQEPLWSSSLGRAAFVLFLILLAIYLQRILHPVRGAMQQVRLRSSRGWFYRTRYAWYPLAFGSPLLLAILTAIGYYDTARTLAAHLFATAFLVLALAILRGLLSRWLLLSRRKLGMQQLQQRREAARAAANSDAAVSGAAIAESEELELDLATLSDQTRRLINATIVLLGTMVAWTVWDDVFPAFKILDSVRFRGGTIPLTLADVLLGIAALGLTYVAARNLPGLFEFTVLRHLPVDAGTRYAMTTVCQYLLAMAGVAISGTLLGITWDSIQWLVAAMAVGLGFGLQEIFANFVSGMILLFERPIRVGDVVTLGDTTGTVTRIRFRATTIKDWDRKEYIVPNKDLVTGRVLNWTLTDQTSRVVISVGIAYGSDTGQACRLLKKVAHDHPIVLDDPPPMATFEGFGDSVLNLILRCYLPDLEHRLTTIHQLHTAVDRTFREADIEIAFPQRDLHIRTVNQALVQETAP